MSLQITTDATACGKCGGRLVEEQIGKEIDVVCRNCGQRQEAVARVSVIQYASADKVAGPNTPRHFKIQAACGSCWNMFAAWNDTAKYCSHTCRSKAYNLRRRALEQHHA